MLQQMQRKINGLIVKVGAKRGVEHFNQTKGVPFYPLFYVKPQIKDIELLKRQMVRK